MAAVDRFWAKVNKQGRVVRPELGPCWEWTAALTRTGYGWFNAVKADGPLLAHRYSWAMANSDPGRLQVCHRCDNPPCVRPDHLFLGTDADNRLDAAGKGRLAQKLEAWKVRSIRIMLAAGVRTKDIAKRFGVDSCTITDISKGRTWKHVDDGDTLGC